MAAFFSEWKEGTYPSINTKFLTLSGKVPATRPDIIGEKVAKDLEKLQDKLPAFDLYVAKNILKKGPNWYLSEIVSK